MDPLPILVLVGTILVVGYLISRAFDACSKQKKRASKTLSASSFYQSRDPQSTDKKPNSDQSSSSLDLRITQEPSTRAPKSSSPSQNEPIILTHISSHECAIPQKSTITATSPALHCI